MLYCPFRGSHECSSVTHNVCIWPPGVEDAASLCFCTVFGVISCSGDSFCRLLWYTIFTSPCLYIIAVFLLAVVYLRVPVFSMLFPYAEAIHDYCGGNLTVTGVKATAGIFATYPAPYLSLLAGFIDQVAMKPD